MTDEFPEKGMTYRQFAQQVIPGLSDEHADWVLWERTPFPLVVGRDDLRPHLEAERDRLARREQVQRWLDERPAVATVRQQRSGPAAGLWVARLGTRTATFATAGPARDFAHRIVTEELCS